jgi:hypothetical protein
MLGVTDDTAGSSDVVVDHRHDGVIRDAAFVRAIVIQHVSRSEPAFLHATPPKKRPVERVTDIRAAAPISPFGPLRATLSDVEGSRP